MSHALAWFAAAGILAAAEIFVGTFHLLVLAVAFAAAAIAAAFGLPIEAQLITAALAGAAGSLASRRFKSGPKEGAHLDPNVNMDIGQTISVDPSQWNDGRARVLYRGAPWDAELGPEANPKAGVFTIREVRGSRLILH